MATAGRTFGIRDLARLALWGLAAVGALALVAYAGTTERGAARLRLAAGEIMELVRPSGRETVRPLEPREARRLADTVRKLAAEREQLLARIAALEKNLGDVTGAIERAARTPPPIPPAIAMAEPDAAATALVSAATDSRAAETRPAATAPADTSASEGVTRRQFGIDLGRAANVEGLRALWSATRSRHAAQLEGLRPIVHLREIGRAGGVELRLVAGPIANAATAARLCAALTAAGALCQPAVFEGQRLPLR